jgi:hypothetical protein
MDPDLLLRLWKFSPTGSFIAKWGTSGAGDGQFNIPEQIAVDSSDSVYVTDVNNHRVQKFSSTGTYITQWGTPGDPLGIAVDASGNVYVAFGNMYANDPANDQIRKFWSVKNSSDTMNDQSARILVIKDIAPKSMKQGTDAQITITISNRGNASVHDVEILDIPEAGFPVVNGITQYTTQLIEPNDTKILRYTVHATKPGSFRLNKTVVMFADQVGNYHLTYSNYEDVRVLPSLLAPVPEDQGENFFQNLIAWIKGF